MVGMHFIFLQIQQLVSIVKNIKTQIDIAPEVGCTLKNIKMQIGTRVQIGGGGPTLSFPKNYKNRAPDSYPKLVPPLAEPSICKGGIPFHFHVPRPGVH